MYPVLSFRVTKETPSLYCLCRSAKTVIDPERLALMNADGVYCEKMNVAPEGRTKNERSCARLPNTIPKATSVKQ